MKDEGRQTRLLLFRRARGFGRDGDATAAARQDEPAADEELRALLRAWEAEAMPHGARERALELFRRRASQSPLWRRLLAASVPAPLAAAACALAAVAAAAFALVARAPSVVEVQLVSTPSEVVRTVEVPVPVEKVVTRVVRSEPRAQRGESRHATGKKQKGDGRSRAGKAAGYFTSVDMAEYQPADGVKIRIIGKGGGGEN